MPKARSKAVENPLMQQQVEISKLKLTIMAQRDALEKQKIDNETHLQVVVAGINDEVSQLKAAISALREELEHGHGHGEDGHQH